MQDQFTRYDTKEADGVYVRFERIEIDDSDATPLDYLYQDPDYKEEDDARLAAWRAGDWCFIGVRAKATVDAVQNHTGTSYTLTSAGLWGIESDSDSAYLTEVYNEECDGLLSDIRAMHTVQEVSR